MKHLFIAYELALKLKEKGFDEECLAYWNTTDYVCNKIEIESHSTNNNTRYFLNTSFCSAPLYQQVIDWLREDKQIWVQPDYYQYTEQHFCSVTFNYKNPSLAKVETYKGDTYYEALDKAITEALIRIS